MNPEERTHTTRLLQLHTAHLRDLELKAAKYGDLDVPTHITLQIADYREKIAQLKGHLNAHLPLHNLPPRDYEQFVGRQKELVDVQELLLPYPRSRAYVITIDGIGGIGKSALALETAYHFRDQYANLPEAERFEAIVWVSAKRSYLTANGILERHQAFRALDDLYAAIAQVLDYPAITRARAEEQRTIVEDVLREQRTLLILDNLETVDDEELLSFLHELPDPAKAIVTTRHRIDVARPIRLTGMPHTDALALIAQESTRKDVVLPAEEQEQLWQRTGGLPLAIVWSIGLMGLGGSVESVLRRLGSGQSDIARFCFEESIAQIRGRDAHSLLLALSLFATDASREALGIVAGLGEDEFGRDMGLEKLLRLSLVNKEGDRFSLLPLTKGFLLETKKQEVKHNSYQDQYKRYMITITYHKHEAHQPENDSIEQELNNILPFLSDLYSSIRFKKNESDDVYIADESLSDAQMYVEIVGSIAWTLRLRGYWQECEYISLKAITIYELFRDYNEIGWRHNEISRIRLQQSDLDVAEIHACQAQHYWNIAGERVRESYAIHRIGQIHLERGNIRDARTYLLNAFHIYNEYRDWKRNYPLLFSLGDLAKAEGNIDEAVHYYKITIDTLRENTNDHELAARLISYGEIVGQLGQQSEELACYEEGLSIAREWGRTDVIARALYKMASLSSINKELAENHARQALDLFRRLGMKREQAEAEALLAQLEKA